jgi:hypothetical protein
MKKLFILLAFISLNVFAQTKIPVQLINPVGSTSNQVIASTGPTTAPAWTTFTLFSYPGAGIPNSTGLAWGTSYSVSGSGSVALTTSPTFITPILGTPTSGVITNLSGTCASCSIGGTAASSSLTLDLAGGSANSIAYQSSANVTTFFSASNYGIPIYGSTGAPSSIAGSAGVLVGSTSAIPAFSLSPTLTNLTTTGLLTAAAGSSTNPSINFTGATLTGFYYNGSGVGISISGSTVGNITASGWNPSIIVNPTYPAGIKGNITGTTPNAGSVGEYPTPAVATAVSMTTATPANITSMTLGAGDWDVTGTANISAAASTVITTFTVSLNTTSATLGGFASNWQESLTQPAAVFLTNPLPTIHVLSNGSTTVYCVGSITFTVSTATASCQITARRR